MSKYFVNIVLLLLLSFNGLYSQNYILSTTDLAHNEAIEANITDIHKDKNGFIWILAPSNLVRFDGHQYKVFNTNNSKLRSITTGYDRKLVEDNEGYIWIAGDNSIDLIHQTTFEIVPFEEQFPDAPFKGSIRSLTQMPDGTILFWSFENRETYSYHPKEGFQRIPFFKKYSHLVPRGKSIWAIDDGRYFRKYDFKTGEELLFFKRTPSFIYPISNYKTEDVFWKVEGDALIFMNAEKDGLKEIASFKTSQIFDKNWKSIFYHAEHDVFLAQFHGSDNQLVVIDLDAQTMTEIEQSNLSVLEKINWGIVDDNNIIWASNRRNIQLLQLNLKKFTQYPPYKSTRGIWVNDDYIFSRYGKTSLQNGTVTTSQLLGGFNAAAINIQNEWWLGGKFSIAQFDTANLEKLQEFSTDNIRTGFWSILKDNQDNWWAGTLNRGVFYKSNSDKLITRFDKYSRFEPAEGAIHLLEDGEYIWACARNGLYLIHKQNGTIARFWSAAKAEFQIPFDDIHFIHKDKKGTYWLASSGNGMFRFQLDDDFQIAESKHFTINDGLPSNTIYCFLEDENERIWGSTYNGLFCFDKSTEAIQIFNQADGIVETEFNRSSFFKAKDGRMYFGSLNGVTGFHPNEVFRTSNLNAPIVMTYFSVYKKDKQWLDETIKVQKSKQIRLQPADRIFKMSISMLDYFDASKIKYAYKIDGLYDNFQKIEGNTIEIGGLPYGQYRLQIQGKGADGRISAQILELDLVVLRPFYLRWWFILLVLVAIIICVVQISFWRVRQLNQRKRELELMVKERTSQIQRDKTTIEEQAEQLKELDKVKSRFFANISHELRTPLTLILSPLDRLVQRSDFSNKDFTTFKMMQQNSQKLLKRINELLDLSRMDANKMEIHSEPTYLYPFIKNIISSIDSVANAKGIQILFQYALNENLQLLLDTDKTEKIISNYLSNALKFTPKNGTITINAQRIQEELQISVSDTGIGIPDNEIHKVFDRFYQSKDQSTQRLNTNSSGIGLALCQELAKVLNGKVWAESEIGKGSTFFMQIPMLETFAVKAKETIIESPTETKSEITKQPISKDKSTILIVEDNADLRQYISSILSETYNVETAEHGKEALNKLSINNSSHEARPSNYQLIISDIMMPVMDGIEFLQKIKQDDQLQHIPVIMLTARQSTEVKLDALRIGVDDYLTKPFKEEELLVRVANLIRNSQNRKNITIEEEPDETMPALSEKDLEWLKKLENILLQNLTTRDYKLADTAEELNVSYRHLRYKTKQLTGLSLKQYQKSIRLAKARNILKSHEVQTVQEVMYQIGLENYYHFSKMYEEAYGVKPSSELK